MLKTRASSLGFNREELLGVADIISNNHALTDDSTEEEVNAQIEAVLPFLQVGQKHASRLSREAKNLPNPDAGNGGKAPSVTAPQLETDEPAWFRAYREAQEARFEALESQKQAESREARLQELLKDAGAYGRTILSSAKRMNFSNEEDFSEWLTQVSEDLQSYRQEQSDNVLGGNAKPNGSQGGGSSDVASVEEIKELAKLV